MVNNSININKTNNHLSEHKKKDHDIWRLKSRSWLGLGTNMTELNQLMRSQPFPLDNWISNNNT